jgi:hypothetical protein
MPYERRGVTRTCCVRLSVQAAVPCAESAASRREYNVSGEADTVHGAREEEEAKDGFWRRASGGVRSGAICCEGRVQKRGVA